jgi:signal transduction histidine kinase
MKRLWVRIGLMIAGVLFFMFFLQYLQITLDHLFPGFMGENQETPALIQRKLVGYMLFSIAVGTGGGFLIGRVVSAPIGDLVKAARRFGKGELDVRVPPRGSQEMVELADTFNKMAADLQQAEILRSNLMADVSHELRTPLTVLEGNLRAALDHVVPLDEVEIANLYNQTRHLTRLVNDLHELTLAESGHLLIEKVPADIHGMVAEILQALEPLATEKNITLFNQVEALPEAVIDSMRIRQVLFNLLSNALRHTQQGGAITVYGTTSSGNLRIAVADTGEGLDGEQLYSVFNRFYRADKSRSRDTGGTGLGLAIVKAIIEAHGGAVEAASAGPGQGCTFTITLPC